MFKIGCHLSISKGFEHIGKEALSIGANTFQFFTRNPRGAKAKEIDIDDINKLLKLMKENNFAKVLAHAPYILNACSSKEETRDLALQIIQDDLMRMEYLPNNLYNFHPGSHVGQGVEVGVNQIADMLNKVITKDQTTIVLLETMSGKGSEVGRSFEELSEIISKVSNNDKVGVCLDTCHINDAGYDVVNKLDDILNNFDKIIGLDRLYAVHLNDTMNPTGSHKDRHQKLGEGYIGLGAVEKIINHEALRDLPFYLETPNDIEGYRNEIEILKQLYRD